MVGLVTQIISLLFFISIISIVIGVTVWAVVRAPLSMIQGPVLTGDGADTFFGSSVSLSYDGNTLAVGDPNRISNAGGTWIFTRNNTKWSKQTTNALVGTGTIGTTAQQGSVVSLSSDGNTLLTTGPGDNSNYGAFWMFTRSGSLWSQAGNKIIAAGQISTSQGGIIALSGDGNTAVYGNSSQSNNHGAIWIFTRSGNTWVQQAGPLSPSNVIFSQCFFGWSISINQNGNVVLAGAYNETGGGLTGAGASWIYTLTNNVWTNSAKLIGTPVLSDGHQGTAVALSADGLTAMIGAEDDGSAQQGAVYAFTNTGTNQWVQSGPKIVPLSILAGDGFGSSIVVSPTGDEFVAAAAGGANVGKFYVYTKIGGAWTQQGNARSPTGVGNYFATSFSLSGNAQTLAIGNLDGTGDVYIYV